MPYTKFKTVLQVYVMLFALVLLSACGYKPSSHSARVVLKETVSTEVVISMQDPENAVQIRDVLNRAIITRFHASLRDRAHAQSHLKVILENVAFTPLQYDENGYIITYRAKTTLHIIRTTAEVKKTYRAYGTFDFAIEPNAIISDQARLDAIEFGSQKALDSFVAQVSAEGVRQHTE